MAVDAKHPLWTESIGDWELMRDSYKGERAVKERGDRYLPPTANMRANGYASGQGDGFHEYCAYRTRAVYHDYVKDAVNYFLGLMHRKPPKIKLPSALSSYVDRITERGESLDYLLRRINFQQIVAGRIGLLVDLPQALTQGNVLPYIATYYAENIINWDDGTNFTEFTQPRLNLVVLDESSNEREGYNWKLVDKYRVLTLGDPEVNEAPGEAATYFTMVERKDGARTLSPRSPSLAGTTLTEIPFTFVNACDLVADPDQPPLLGLATICMAMYRTEADYRQNLFMQGQDTLVVIGGQEDDYRTGAGAVIKPDMGGDAKYVGVQSAGLAEQRQALENDKREAAIKAGQNIDAKTRTRESGDALKIRVSSQTATLNQIALTGAAGLQAALRQAATWRGLDPDQVIVEPNLDFADSGLGSRNLVELMTAKSLGAPISTLSIHTLMKAQGMTEMTFDDEIKEIGNDPDITPDPPPLPEDPNANPPTDPNAP